MHCSSDPGHACEFESRGRFLDRSGVVGSVEIASCSKCGHSITLPPIEDVSFLYADRASQDFQPDSKKGFSHAIKDIVFRRDARRLLHRLGAGCGSILDFGCGSGQFTRVLSEVHVQGSVTGADMHKEPPAELAGRGYLGKGELSNASSGYDVVLAMQVLEHDDDIQALLAQITGLARTGGRVVIEVPNVLCPWNRIFGKYWDAWYVPYHRHHFTRQSLVRHLELGGLVVDHVEPVTIPTMGRTFANLFGSSNNLLWLVLGIVAHPIQVFVERLSAQPTAWRAFSIKS